MSHYDEARDAWDSMSENERYGKYKADDARERYIRVEDSLKDLLLEKFLKKKGIVEKDSDYNHNTDYWDNKSLLLKKQIKKLNKKKDK